MSGSHLQVFKPLFRLYGTTVPADAYDPDSEENINRHLLQ